MPRLTRKQRNSIKKLLNRKPWNLVHEYGSRSSDIKPCKRVQSPSLTCNNPIQDIYGGWTLNCYEAAYLYHHGQTPTDSLSHLCASVYLKRGEKYKDDDGKRKRIISNCIEGSHIVCEPLLVNIDRNDCHKVIRKWEKKNRWWFHDVKGPLKLSIIQEEMDKKNDISKRTRKKLDRRGQHGDYWCRHGDTCFINYGQL